MAFRHLIYANGRHFSLQRSLPLPQRSLPMPQRSLPMPQRSLPTPQRSLPMPQRSLPLPQRSLPLPQRSFPTRQRSLPFRRCQASCTPRLLPGSAGWHHSIVSSIRNLSRTRSVGVRSSYRYFLVFLSALRASVVFSWSLKFFIFHFSFFIIYHSK